MENSYCISIKNKYELFLENDDPLEILREQERKAAAKKAEKSKKSSSDKDAKGSAKNKQNKTTASANVAPTTAQEVKTEKIEVIPSPGKAEDKQRRQKSSEDEPRLLKDRGNRQKPAKEEAPNLDEGDKLEIGTFETRGPSAGTRERRGGRGRGGGFRNTTERSPKENFDFGGGPERRPRRGSNRGFRQNNYGLDRNGENQENGNPEMSNFDSRPNFSANGFGHQEDRRERQFNNEERRGFGRRREDGEGRPFGGFRRSYEGRPPRRNFAPRPQQDGGVDAGADDLKTSGFDEPQQEVGSFGHWGENSGGDDGVEGTRGRGRGSGRRARGRGRGNFGGRREFSRRGGSNEGGVGIKPVEKRDGTGSHNWGTVMDDLEAQSEVVTGAGASWADQAEAAENMENAGNVGATYEDESGAAAPTEPAEPELETMTLDEYKAAMEAKRLKMEFNIRKPNEGCSDDKWKKTYVLKKKEQTKGEEDDEEGEAAEDDKHGKNKNILPIEITFSDSRRGSRGRAFTGRRGGRGNFSGERGGFAGRRGTNPGVRGGDKKLLRERAPNVDDEQDFPSLVPAGSAQ